MYFPSSSISQFLFPLGVNSYSDTKQSLCHIGFIYNYLLKNVKIPMYQIEIGGRDCLILKLFLESVIQFPSYVANTI